MQTSFNAIIFEEDGWHIAQCIEIDVASQGNTLQEAFDNLKEAIRLHLMPPSSSILGSYAQSPAQAQSMLPASTIKSWDLENG